MPTIQFSVTEEQHKKFKIWCIMNGEKMAKLCRQFVAKTLEGKDIEQITKEIEADFTKVKSYQAIQLMNNRGQTIELPLPNLLTEGETERTLMVPDDTSESDIEALMTIPNIIIRTNVEWKTSKQMRLVE